MIYVFLLSLLSCAATSVSCDEPGKFRISLVNPGDYFILKSTPQTKVQRTGIEGRTYWKVDSDPWHLQVFAYKVEPLRSREDFRVYAEFKRQVFRNQAQNFVADLEKQQGIVFPKPIETEDWHTKETFYEYFISSQINGDDYHLIQANLIRFYRFSEEEGISLETTVRGLSKTSFDLGQVDSLLVPCKEPLRLVVGEGTQGN